MKNFFKIFLIIMLLLSGLSELIIGLLVIVNFNAAASAFNLQQYFSPEILNNPGFMKLTILFGSSLIFISMYFFMNIIFIIKKNPSAITFAFLQALLLIIIGIAVYPKVQNTSVLLTDLVRGILIFISALLYKLSLNKQ